MSFASLSMTPAGVPGGHPYSIPNRIVEPGTPASAMVGTSGSKDKRFFVVTPSARKQTGSNPFRPVCA
jgi:hypothetical protein